MTPSSSRSKSLRTKLMRIGALGLVFCALSGAASYALSDAPHPVPKTVTQDPTLPSMDVEGVKLHVQTFGDPSAPVVIVVHGGPGEDHRMLLSLKPLADRYFVVFYDQRGSGLSERVPDDALTYLGMRQELGALVDHFSPTSPVSLVGHSWGAMLAAGYTGAHPERVRSLVLAEPGFLTPDAGRAFIERMSVVPPLQSSLVSGVWDAGLEWMKIDGPDEDAAFDHFMRRIATMTEVEGHPMAGYFCEGKPGPQALQHYRFGARASLVMQSAAMDSNGEINAPFGEGLDDYPGEVLFLTGACNRLTGTEHQERFHRGLFAHTSLVELEGTGHLMFAEQPQLVLQAITNHLQRIQGTVERTAMP